MNFNKHQLYNYLKRVFFGTPCIFIRGIMIFVFVLNCHGTAVMIRCTQSYDEYVWVSLKKKLSPHFTSGGVWAVYCTSCWTPNWWVDLPFHWKLPRGYRLLHHPWEGNEKSSFINTPSLWTTHQHSVHRVRILFWESCFTFNSINYLHL